MTGERKKMSGSGLPYIANVDKSLTPYQILLGRAPDPDVLTRSQLHTLLKGWARLRTPGGVTHRPSALAEPDLPGQAHHTMSRWHR